MIEEVAAKRAKTHTRYYSKDGTMLPGITTILGVLNKPALVPWANKLGLAGIDVKEYVDTLAEIGTICHAMILAHNKKVPFEHDGQRKDFIDKAENGFLSYLEWERKRAIEPILCETPLISEKGYGGTLDFYGLVDGVRVINEYKTGKIIYPEHVYQAAAQRELLEENGYKVDAVRILQIGRDETEGFSERVVTDTSRELEIFHHCLALYKLKVGK